MRDLELPEDRQLSIAEHLDICATCRETFAPASEPTAKLQLVGRYILRRSLGAGGMGVVYEADDPQLDRRVAIKLVRPEHLDDDARRRLLREARALAKISHPNVVTVHDAGEHGRQVFVATELVHGETLQTWQVGRTWRAVVDAWLQVARGLAAAHAGGIVHRDIKPSNVFVGRDGRVRIGDFGIARDHGDVVRPVSPAAPKRTASGSLATSVIAGTPGYMAPEQLRGVVDARSDQFSLCVAIIEGLTAARPVAGVMPPLPGVPDALRDVLRRGMAVDPQARFPAMHDLANALASALEQPVRVPGAVRRWIAIPIAVAGAAITAGLVAAVVARPDPVHIAGAVIEAAATAPQAQVATLRVDDSTPPTSAGPDGSARFLFADAPDRASGPHRRPPRRPAPVDDAQAAVLIKQARAIERAGQWDEARAIYQRLEAVKGYRAEALYREAWAAFQMNDIAGAQQLAAEAAREPGTFQNRARLLYGDALFRQGEYARAKNVYLAVRGKAVGDERATATKKIAVCNKMLDLPSADGVTD